MKRILSVVLVMAMICSMSTAFAAEVHVEDDFVPSASVVPQENSECEEIELPGDDASVSKPDEETMPEDKEQGETLLQIPDAVDTERTETAEIEPSDFYVESPA